MRRSRRGGRGRILAGGLALLAVLAAGGERTAAGGGPELLVAAASDLVFAFREIVPAFEREERTRVTLTLGSTGQLAQQIEHGAPFDVFFAANQAFVERLRLRGAVRPDSLVAYAQGVLVLAAPAGAAPLGGLGDLTREAVRRVAIANPVHAPYGMAAKEALERSGLWERVRPKLVYGENISQALQFLRTRNVEAAILALSVALVPEVQFVRIDPALHQPLVQVAAVTARARQPDLARAFLRYVNGPEGRPVMTRFGFLLPGDF